MYPRLVSRLGRLLCPLLQLAALATIATVPVRKTAKTALVNAHAIVLATGLGQRGQRDQRIRIVCE